MYKFTLPFPPSNNTYYRHVDSKVLLSEKGRKYKKLVTEFLRLQLINNRDISCEN